jgi:hypothetical protein
MARKPKPQPQDNPEVPQESQPERVQAEPVDIVVAKNGALRDAKTGRIVPGGKITTAITPSNAVAMANSRWQKYHAAAVRGLRSRSASNNALDAWSDIVAAQADLATDTDKGRASTEAARFVAQAVDAVPNRQAAGGGDNPAVALNLNAQALKMLIDAVQQARTGQAGDNA